MNGYLYLLYLLCQLLNACSIRNKINELEVHVNNEELDIIAVTETWLTEDVLDSELLIPGFTLYKCKKLQFIYNL